MVFSSSKDLKTGALAFKIKKHAVLFWYSDTRSIYKFSASINSYNVKNNVYRCIFIVIPVNCDAGRADPGPWKPASLHSHWRGRLSVSAYKGTSSFLYLLEDRDFQYPHTKVRHRFYIYRRRRLSVSSFKGTRFCTSSCICCGYSCRDPENLHRPASSLVRAPYTWSGGHKLESTAGENLVHWLKVGDPTLVTPMGYVLSDKVVCLQ